MGNRRPWIDMADAPHDGTVIEAKAGSREFPVKWEGGFLDEDERDCACWVALEDGNHPSDWCDGVCWASNSNGDPSTALDAWRPYHD